MSEMYANSRLPLIIVLYFKNFVWSLQFLFHKNELIFVHGKNKIYNILTNCLNKLETSNFNKKSKTYLVVQFPRKRKDDILEALY